MLFILCSCPLSLLPHLVWVLVSAFSVPPYPCLRAPGIPAQDVLKVEFPGSPISVPGTRTT